MNNRILASLAILGSALSAAAGVNVSAPVRLSTGDAPAHNPVMSPDGSMVLFSADDQTGLNLLSVADGKVVTIENDVRGAGFSPVFSADSKTIIYQTAKTIDGLMNRDVRSFTIADGKKSEIAPMSRADIDLNASAAIARYAKSNFCSIVISDGSSKSEITPLPDAHSYLWPSLSPDGKRLLFVEPFQGLFIADADGSNPVKIADKADFPAWVSNDIISFVTSHDDGYTILDSTLKAYDMVSGETTDITTPEVLVGEASAANSTVVYTTLNGEMYSVTVTK